MSGWARPMAEAYSAGLADARAGRPPAPINDFVGCYLQGYRHGAR